MKKGWQRFLACGLMFVLFASSMLVRPLSAADELTKLNRDYVDALEIVRNNYIEPVEYETLNKVAIQTMLHMLDPHSSFYDRKAFDELRSDHSGQYYGIGATIGGRDRAVYVLETAKGAPASRAGLRYGDQFFEIDGKNVEKLDSKQIQNLLRGERGTKVTLTVKRLTEAAPVTVTIQRDVVDHPSVSDYFIVRPGVGYIALARGFYSTTGDEVSLAIARLKEQGATSMILDLRNNPGGLVTQAVRVCERFLQRGQLVVSIRGRSQHYPEQNLSVNSSTPETFPLAVLINGFSASASEIVAGAMQDHDRGLLVGENSFGKGLVQTIIPLDAGTGLTLTTQRYYAPSGRLIQRDYSNGSFYEYIYKRSLGEAAVTKSRTEEWHTDTGRVVASGKGIEPDVKVESDKVTRGAIEIWNTGLFMFTRDLVAGKVAAAPNFKLGAIEFDHKLKPNEFVITDEIMNAFRAFMTNFIKERPEYGLTQAMVDDNLTFERNKIREEVLTAAYGSAIGQRGGADLDKQLQRAIAELPNAAALAAQAQRGRRASR